MPKASSPAPFFPSVVLDSLVGSSVMDFADTLAERQHFASSRSYARLHAGFGYTDLRTSLYMMIYRDYFKKEILSGKRTNLTKTGRRGREESLLGKGCQVSIRMPKIRSPPCPCFDSCYWSRCPFRKGVLQPSCSGSQ